MTLVLRYSARSDRGLVRQNNQDAVYAGPRLLALADGMGGHAAGEVASSLVIAALAAREGVPLIDVRERDEYASGRVPGAVNTFLTAPDLAAGVVFGLVAIGAQSLVEFSLQMPGNAALFAVVCGIACSQSLASGVSDARMMQPLSLAEPLSARGREGPFRRVRGTRTRC